jgi:hypothetical protein
MQRLTLFLHRPHLSFVFMILFLPPACAPAVAMSADGQEAGDTQWVSVEVRFRTWDDQPLADIPLGLWRRNAPNDTLTELITGGMTDERGVVLFEADVPREIQYLFIGPCLSHRPDGSKRPFREQRTIRHRILALQRTHSLPFGREPMTSRRITVSEAVLPLHFELKTKPAVVIKGRIIKEHEIKPVRNACIYVKKNRQSRNYTDASGEFEVLAMPRGEDAEIYAYTVDHGFITARSIPGEMLEEDLEIEAWRMPEPAPGTPINVRMQGTPDLSRARRESGDGGILMRGATFISQDGERAHTYWEGGDGSIQLIGGGENSATLPPGTYYIAPGVFQAVEIQCALWDAIRSGVDVASYGVPVLVVGDEPSEEQIVIDAVAAARAIRAIMKDQANPDSGAQPQPPTSDEKKTDTAATQPDGE